MLTPSVDIYLNDIRFGRCQHWVSTPSKAVSPLVGVDTQCWHLPKRISFTKVSTLGVNTYQSRYHLEPLRKAVDIAGMYVKACATQTDWIDQAGRKDKMDKLGLSCEENGVKRGGIGQRAKWGRVKLQGQIDLFLRGRDFPVILPPAPFTQSWSWGGGAWTPKTDSTQAHFYPFQLLPTYNVFQCRFHLLVHSTVP